MGPARSNALEVLRSPKAFDFSSSEVKVLIPKSGPLVRPTCLFAAISLREQYTLLRICLSDWPSKIFRVGRHKSLWFLYN